MLAALAAASPAQAQSAAFGCLGAERLEDEVFVVSFARGSAVLGDSARSALAAALQAAGAEPGRNVCVLGHAGQEGGAVTSTRLAAQRARAVADALAQGGLAAARIRAEARSAQFSQRVRAAEPPSRTVSIVVLPAPP